jgi:tetratricopeptide (TPR) repeat protein
LAIRGHSLARFRALENWNQFQGDLHNAQFVLYGRAPNREKLDQGIDLCQNALDHYHVLQDANWNQLPVVHNLPAVERKQLHDDIGELLFLTARATSAKASYDPAHPRLDDLALALRLSQSAEGAYDSDKIPRALWQQQAELLQLLGKGDEASALFQKADQTPPRTAHDYYLEAQHLVMKGNFRKALPLLDEAVQMDPQYFSAWFVLGNCHDGLLHYGNAIACYSTCIALRPEFHWSWFNRAMAFYRLGNFERAVADFDQTIRLKPDLADAYLNRGLAHEGLAHYADGIRDLSTALDLGTPRTQVYFFRAAVREKAKDREGAKRDWELGMKLQPADEQSWVSRGLARQDKDSKGALADFDEALKLNPRSFPALQNKAHVLADLVKDDKEAVVVLGTAVAMFPDSAMARAGRGVSRARLGYRVKALADAEEALLLDTSPPNLYQVAGIYALTSKNHPEDRLRALQLLAYGLKGGFGLDLVDTDTDLDPIRQAPEFRRLVTAAKELHLAPGTSR